MYVLGSFVYVAVLKMDYRNGYTGKLKRLMMHHPWVDPKQASNWQHHRDNLIFMHLMRRQLCNPFILWISTSWTHCDKWYLRHPFRTFTTYILCWQPQSRFFCFAWMFITHHDKPLEKPIFFCLIFSGTWNLLFHLRFVIIELKTYRVF